MTLECINPKDLPTPQTYTQVVVATGSKLVFVSGQEPEDIHGKLVGPGDLAVQARQVFGNLGRALAAAGARPDQVSRITIYVVNYNRDECLPINEAARKALFGEHKPADVVVGVATLSRSLIISPEFSELLGYGSALGVTRPSGGRAPRQIHHVHALAQHVLRVAVRDDGFDGAVACA